MIMIIVTIISALSTFLFGFCCGKISERKDWNKLIDDGILPKPKKRI